MAEVKVMVHVRVDGRCRVTIPKPVRDVMGIRAGDVLRMVGEDGRVVLTKVG